jgi:hypothetical protein
LPAQPLPLPSAPRRVDAHLPVRQQREIALESVCSTVNVFCHNRV